MRKFSSDYNYPLADYDAVFETFLRLTNSNCCGNGHSPPSSVVSFTHVLLTLKISLKYIDNFYIYVQHEQDGPKAVDGYDDLTHTHTHTHTETDREREREKEREREREVCIALLVSSRGLKMQNYVQLTRVTSTNAQQTDRRC